MGILNVTPDSFSDGGCFFTLEESLAHAMRLVAEGADIIDVGGESTRPGSLAVSAKEEMRRVIPLIRRLSRELDAPISIDTYKAEVAEAALEAGASMLNDVWGGRRERAMLMIAAARQVPICLMHNKEVAEYVDLVAEVKASLLEEVAEYGDLLAEVKASLLASAELAESCGVRRENIVLDPGIGFGKTALHNLVIMQRLAEITALGYPVLLGTSRKSFIGKVLDLPVEERGEGTAATVAYGITRGVRLVRVHDVAAMHRVAKMTDALLRGGFSNGG